MSRNETMTFKNPTDRTVKLEAVGLDDVAPGGSVEVPIELAAPTLMANGQRGKSSLECVAPQLIPANATDQTAWEKTPTPPAPTSKIVSIQKAAQSGEPPGVKALRLQREAAVAAEAAKKAPAPSAPVKP